MNEKLLLLGVVAVILLVSSGGLQSIAQVGGSELTPEGTFVLTAYEDYSHSFLGITKGYTYPLVSVDEAQYSLNGISTGWFYQEKLYSAVDRLASSADYYSKTGNGKTLTYAWTHDYGDANRQLGDFQAAGGGSIVLSNADASQPSGENALFTHLGLYWRHNPDYSPYSNAPEGGWELSLPIPKDDRLWVSAKDCPAPAGSSMSNLVLTFQVFDGSDSSISLSDFKHPVRRFCVAHPVQVKLPSGNTETTGTPYGDVILKGAYEFPAGETQVWVYLTDAKEFPQECPSGQAIQQLFSGQAVDYECRNVDMALTCSSELVNGECLSAHQTVPDCETAGLLYNEKTKKCEVQTEFCPGGYLTTKPVGGGNSTFYCASADDKITVDGNAVCDSKFAGSSYFDGKCIAPSTSVSQPVSTGGGTAGGLMPSGLGDLGVIALIVLLGLGGLFYLTKK